MNPSKCCSSADNKLPCIQDSSYSKKNEIPALPYSNKRDRILCRVSNKFRMQYSVAPGLYSIGNPNDSSPVLVTANYRITCDHLYRAMINQNVWVLVHDTKGINVWCAAGKGTFGTTEIINSIKNAGLDSIVKHKNLILPQLGAPGVSALQITKATGFKVLFGPVLARDIPAYIEAGYKATPEMRSVKFPILERLILTPIEFFATLRKYIWVILGIMVLMGIQPTGILYSPALLHSWPLILVGFFSIIIGTIVFPAMLPFFPFRSFALQGAILGSVFLLPSLLFINQLYLGNIFLAFAVILFFICIISYLSLNFTGSTPFTNISGVKREMKFAVPIYISVCILSTLLLFLFKLQEWRKI